MLLEVPFDRWLVPGIRGRFGNGTGKESITFLVVVDVAHVISHDEHNVGSLGGANAGDTRDKPNTEAPVRSRHALLPRINGGHIEPPIIGPECEVAVMGGIISCFCEMIAL